MTTLTRTEAIRLQVLEFLYDAPGRSPSAETSLAPLIETTGDGDAVQDSVRYLKRVGHLMA